MNTTKITIAITLLLALSGVAQGQDQPRERRDSEPRRGAEQLRDRPGSREDLDRPSGDIRAERKQARKLQREQMRNERPEVGRQAMRGPRQPGARAQQQRLSVCPECGRPMGPNARPGFGWGQGQGQMRGQGPVGPLARDNWGGGRGQQFQGPPFRSGQGAPRFNAPPQDFRPGSRGQQFGPMGPQGQGFRGPGAFRAPLQDQPRDQERERPAFRDEGRRPDREEVPFDGPRRDRERERDLE